MSCTLDSLTEADADAAVAAVRAQARLATGLTDAQLDAALAAAARRARDALPRGPADTSQCASVRIDRALALAGLGVQVGLVVAAGVMLAQGGRTSYLAWRVLGVAAAVLLAAQLRHGIGLGAKVAWYGTDKATRAVLAVSLAYTGAASVLQLLPRDGGTARAAVLAALLALGGVRTYYVYESVRQQPEFAVAAVAALNRVLSGKKIRAAREALAV